MAWDIYEALDYYKKQGAPNEQSALLGLLREIQQESGGSIPQSILPSIAKDLGTKENYLLAVIRRIPSLRISQHHVLELCAGPNCGKHTELAAYAEELQRRLGGKLQVRFVPCMRQCGQGPNMKWDGRLYNRTTRELLERLAETIE